MPAPIRFINPEGLVRPAAYTQLVEVAGGSRMLYVSGQLGTTSDGKLASADFRAQAEQVFANLETALAAVGASFADVVKINSFLADIGHLPILREVRAATSTRLLCGPAPPSRYRALRSRAPCSRSRRWRWCRVRGEDQLPPTNK